MQGLPGPGRQSPPLQLSAPLQKAPSSQSPAVSHSLQTLAFSSQNGVAPEHLFGVPLQLPLAHLSLVVQKRLSLHVAVLFVVTQAPLALQVLFVQGSLSLQSTFVLQAGA